LKGTVTVPTFYLDVSSVEVALIEGVRD